MFFVTGYFKHSVLVIGYNRFAINKHFKKIRFNHEWVMTLAPGFELMCKGISFTVW